MLNLNDFQNLSLKELEKLSDDIAVFLADKTVYDVETIMHNISVLETTISLHRVLDLEYDSLIFDDGKESLVHQILTGRMESLKLRSARSLYPDKSDVYTGGAVGDGLGFGLAHALTTSGRTVVIMNDFALNYGPTYEALVQISRLKPDLTLVLIDEQKSLLRHYNSMNAAIKSIRISKTYTEIKKDVKTVLDSNPISRPILTTLSRVRDRVKETVIEPTIFKQFGMDYQGPIDGQNINELMKAFTLSKKMSGPHVIHVQTRIREKKRRKLEFPAFKTDYERPDNYTDYIQTLDQVLVNYDNLVLVNDAHMMADHFKEFMFQYPDAYHTTSGSVELMMSMVAGLISDDVKGVVSLSSHLAPTIVSQVLTHFDLKDLDLTIIIRDTGLGMYADAMNHGIYDFVLALNAPRLKISMAKDMQEAGLLLEKILDSGGLNILRVPSTIEAQSHELYDVSPIWEEVIGLNDTKTSVILTFGPSVRQFERKIKVNQLDIALINCRWVNQIDEQIMNNIYDLGLDVLIYNSEGRFDLLSHSILRYLNQQGLSMRVISKNLESVSLNYGSKQLKDVHHMNIDDILNYLK